MSTVPSSSPYRPTPIVSDDGDYEYTWTLGGIDLPIPYWLAQIVDVRPVIRLEIFLIGLCSGLILAATAVLLAFYITVG